MKAYSEILKQGIGRQSETQLAVGERLLQLGNTEQAFQFIVLAGQSRNTETMAQIVEAHQEVISNFSQRVDELDGSTKTFALAARNLEEPLEGMRRSANIINESTDSFKTSAFTVQNAAEEMKQAAYRMNQ